MEEIASGAECPPVWCFTSDIDDKSRLVSAALLLDFPNMLLSLRWY
jgi:hypothetical protein